MLAGFLVNELADSLTKTEKILSFIDVPSPLVPVIAQLRHICYSTWRQSVKSLHLKAKKNWKLIFCGIFEALVVTYHIMLEIWRFISEIFLLSLFSNTTLAEFTIIKSMFCSCFQSLVKVPTDEAIHKKLSSKVAASQLVVDPVNQQKILIFTSQVGSQKSPTSFILDSPSRVHFLNFW